LPKEVTTSENKMGVMPINKLLTSMSLPIVLSMLVLALYNVVDSIFVAKISENAFTALSLSFPIQNLMIAVAVGTGIGVNALLSRSLGEKNTKAANLAATNGIFLALLSFIGFAIWGLFFSRSFFATQTNDLEIIEYGTQYITICTVLSFGLFFQIAYERIMQSAGYTLYNMITQGIGAIINIILDPILIFGLFGLPKMEVAGAALATVIGQIVAMILCIYFNKTKNKHLHLTLKGFRPHLGTIKVIYIVGIPSIIMQSISSVMTFGMNKILMTYSATAVSVLGAYFKLQSFVFMPVFGLTNGMVPIVAYNYGARNKKRIFSVIKLSCVYAISIMLLGTLIFQVFPNQLFSFFNASEEMIKIGVPALRIISLSFVFAGFSIIVGSVFQALGNGVDSMIISIARQLVVILPAAYIFSETFGLHAVWYAFPIAEIVSIILTLVFFKRIYKKKLLPLS
jgi:putative MATE family efflux protein